VVIKSNGDKLFFNKDNDTIFLKTQAALNDTFTIYTYPNGEWIKGSVSSISEEIVLGQMDSVKTISLFTNASNYAINFQQFQLSKNHGLVELFPFYSFPDSYAKLHFSNSQFDADSISNRLLLTGSETPKFGVTRQTYRAIYDFAVGGIINHTESLVNDQNYYENNFYNKLVIAKDTSSLDTIKYTFSIKSAYEKRDWWAGTYEYTIQPTIIEEKIYSNINSYLHQTLPEESNLLPDSLGFVGKHTILKKDNLCQGLILETAVNPEMVYNSSTGIAEFWNVIPIKNTFHQKIGGPFFNYSTADGNYWDYKIDFISNSAGSCGSEWYLSNNEIEVYEPLVIFPNPSTDFITITMANSSNKDFAVNLFNLQGQLMRTEIVPAATLSYGFQVDMHAFSDDEYILEVVGESFAIHQKIIKY
jgi:hypothetical protein